MATDGSATARKAVQMARDLARRFDARPGSRDGDAAAAELGVRIPFWLELITDNRQAQEVS